MSSTFDYPALLRGATLGVVREVLERTAADGLVGEHHFYLTFRTGDEGVDVPPGFRARYPETMTIVLQHQFAELVVEEDAFAVTLRFGGAWERVRVPFAALTSFLDPSVPFGLDFTQFAGGFSVDASAQEGDGPASGPVAVPSGEAQSKNASPGASDGEPNGEATDRSGDLLPFRRR